jgi:hypothetical protein
VIRRLFPPRPPRMSSARKEFWTTVATVKQVWKYGGQEDDPEDSDDEKDNDDKKDENGGENADDSTHQNANVQALTPRYQYAPLSDAKSCVRLLELQAGQGRDLIVCQLEEIALDASNNKYDALSYVWGPPGGKSRVVQVGGGSFEIGINLHCALENLRHADRPRFLWVDAICVDQSNIAERNVQVPLMCEIYQNAARTVCFLGPANKSTRDMYKMLEELAQERRTLEAEVRTHQSDATNTILPAFLNDLPVAPIKTEVSEKYIGDQTIVSLATNKWWHRAWTVQELMLSSNAVLMLSRYTIAWEDFRVGVDHGLSTQIWGHVAYGFLVNPVTVPYLSMRALMGRYRRPNQMGSSAVDLLHLLIHCRHRDSTDPRDKIYAVLGLLRATHPEVMRHEVSDTLSVALDYDHDVVYVYRETCQELVQKTGNMDILGVCPKSARPYLPSWATDWSIADRIGSPLMQDSLDRARTTHAAKQTRVNARFSDDGASMIITGYELTSAITLAEVLPNPVLKNAAGANYPQSIPNIDVPELEVPENTPRLGRYWLKFKFLMACMRPVFRIVSKIYLDDFMALISVFSALFAWERFAASQPPTNPGETPDAVYWQTLCAGTYKNGSIEETRMLFKTWSNLLQPLRKFMKNHPKFTAKHPFFWFLVFQRATWRSYGEFWPYISCSHHRRLGRAANGWLCLLPQETKVGDVIILARGGRVPLVIRSDEKGYYTFVGEAYIHGIMDGEAFDESKCVDIEIR